MPKASALIDDINQYILANLTEKQSVAGIAKQFGISRFHLHRVFFAETGFDLAEYIARRKMEKALVLMQAGMAGIDIALSLGYESHSAFSRAFKQVYGVTPSHADAEELYNTIIPRYKKGKEAETPIDFTIEERAETQLLGCYATIADMRELPAIASETFRQLIDGAAVPKSLKPVGVSTTNPWFSNTENNSFFFGFASPFTSSYSLAETFQWPAQRYATIVYTGPYALMWQFISRCHAEIVRRKQVILSARTIYQCYLNSPASTQPDELQTKLFFPIEN